MSEPHSLPSGGLGSLFAGWSLSRRFAVTGGVVMLAAMAIIGGWLSSRIRENAIESSAAATALFMDSFISPLAQELEGADALSIGPIRALDEILASPSLAGRVMSIKIWKPGGLVAYASDLELIGKRFAEPESLVKAFSGQVMAEFNALEADESAAERAIGVPLLEIYSPIRENWTGKVIAVAEFYENAENLGEAVKDAWLQSWAAIGLATLLIGGSLFGIVNAGSRMIEGQSEQLRLKVAETERISQENRRLRTRAERASGRVSMLTEASLRRVSADLHDGPAQLVSLAALRLDSLKKSKDAKARAAEIVVMETALGDAIRDIRNICRGLSLPELDPLPLGKAAERAIQMHEALTGGHVDAVIRLGDADAPASAKACLFRFLQEGLNNAWRHAPGGGVKADAVLKGSMLSACVESGPARSAPRAEGGGGLGLPGLKERIESLGGTFGFHQSADGAARLTMAIDLSGGAFDD